MAQGLEQLPRINTESLAERAPYQQVYSQLVQEGVEMYGAIQQSQPSVSSLTQWAAYFHIVIDLYGQIVAQTVNSEHLEIPSSPTIESLRETSPNFLQVVLDEATRLPRPKDGIQQALQQDPTGTEWIQQQVQQDEELTMDNPGVVLALRRSHALYATYQPR